MDQHRKHRIAIIEQLIDESEWTRLAEGVALSPDYNGGIESPGSLVFDVDGVLIDTHHSFREVIPEAANCYLESILGLIGNVRRMQIDDGETIKKAGGFNNDWDVSEAGLIIALWHYMQPWTLPALSTLVEEIAAAGGGIDILKEQMRIRTGEIIYREILDMVDRDLLERICREFYMGETVFHEIYGVDPEYHGGHGGMSHERPTVDGAPWEAARKYPYGIFTGRIPEEMRLAARLLGLSEGPDSDNVVSDDGQFPIKPDPAGLVHLASQMPERPLYYFGDNRDDLTALLRARQNLQDDDLHFICCLTAASDTETVNWFASTGATMLAAELGDALSVLIPSS